MFRSPVLKSPLRDINADATSCARFKCAACRVSMKFARLCESLRPKKVVAWRGEKTGECTENATFKFSTVTPFSAQDAFLNFNILQSLYMIQLHIHNELFWRANFIPYKVIPVEMVPTPSSILCNENLENDWLLKIIRNYFENI